MKITVSLPDGSTKLLDEGARAADLARTISSGLAKMAVVAQVNHQTVDMSRVLADGDRVKILTKRDAEALHTLRHSAAHLMAAAVLEEVPGVQLTIGPATEDGFFYDVQLPADQTLSEADFPRIEKKIRELAQADYAFERLIADNRDSPIYRRYDAIDGGANPFKREIVEGLEAGGAFSGASDSTPVSFYQTGSFIDLCVGPHVPSSGWLKHIKLMKIAGSYWRADALRERLVRIYGTAFFSKKDLDAHLHMLEEAKKRDHRVLGEKLDLFHFEDDAPGFPFLHPKGTAVYNGLMDFMRAQLTRRGYQEVRTPIILPESTWHTSGHYEHYMENMFFTKRKARDAKDPQVIHDDAGEERAMAVKPMNCPGHLKIYKRGLRSHREFPLRMAEMGLVHRREPSGVRHGLFRVQAFVQDDAHHFCTPDQIESEIHMLIDFFFEMYRAFDLADVRLELSTRPEDSIGSDAMWEQAESSLAAALGESGREYQVNAGDGAFYGPKIDFHIRDSIGRSWQCGTIQLDFSMPARFGLEYVGADGGRHTPVMIHRACYGSLERFFGIITEHVAGAFPLWLAPEQVRVLPVSEKFNDYASTVAAEVRVHGLRVDVDMSDERLGYKIRGATMAKVPYVFVVGQQETDAGSINVRCRDADDAGETSVARFIAGLPPYTVAQLVASLEA
ncbi:MAG: threonine--tRNA ligase [Nannocystaceae bacterium]